MAIHFTHKGITYHCDTADEAIKLRILLEKEDKKKPIKGEK